ncbi:protein translocase subunit SecD [Cellulomonas sp.]|uniref:protein translocase subunit SecD n=1 Tax=Cellulomonas sp. TaxID=40001 RepID=UPI00258DFB04|nr:protein translocase subunit SecD [Cellulomonas sp.]MCR6690135.1 protein translocase subunit SecD [Cellulomonas sp.]
MRTLVVLAVVVVLPFLAVLIGTRTSDATWSPKLALDLEGGTQIILTPVSEDGTEPSSEDISQAINVIRQRIDGSGVSEAEISSQGGNNIVVAIPGKASDETIASISRSSHMEFRPVLQQGYALPAVEPTAVPSADPSAEPSAGPSAEPSATPTGGSTLEPSSGASEDTSADANEAPSAEPTATGTPAPTPTPSAPAAPSEPSSASDAAYWVTPEVQKEFDDLDCTDPANLAGGISGDPDAAFVTCSIDITTNQSDGLKYILGPVEIDGKEISSASSGLETLANGAVGSRWVVSMEFTGKGSNLFSDVTTRIKDLSSPQNQFAMVLDGLIISAPSVDETIPNGRAQISGTFTQSSAAELANRLNFGSLPLNFKVQSEQQISATLGSEQLEKGLLAGIIGLLLVVVYSLFQYRALGLLTVASLLIAATLTYGVITLMSWTQGYRLSLPGVAGLIVAIGITADSFIVYFERIRDELREGRVLGSAVERGWDRAKRTILASDAVNLIAAIVLYFLAVGGVRGFAFTLGLTTVIDVIVVFLFTHPMMELLAKTRFFNGGHPASGLDPRRLGVPGTRYVGRGKVVTGPREDARPEAGAGSTPGESGMTIAERRAAQRAAESVTTPADAPVTEDKAGDARAEGSDR